jgi:hypothetical protein
MKHAWVYIGLFGLVLATGKVFNTVFYLMNMQSDLAYYAGAIGAVVWLLVAFGIGRWLFQN